MGGRWVGRKKGGRWVGRKKGGRWVGIGRSFPKKKTWGQGWAQKKIDKKNCSQKKKN